MKVTLEYRVTYWITLSLGDNEGYNTNMQWIKGLFRHSENKDYIRTHSNENAESGILNQMKSRVILCSELHHDTMKTRIIV